MSLASTIAMLHGGRKIVERPCLSSNGWIGSEPCCLKVEPCWTLVAALVSLLALTLRGVVINSLALTHRLP